MTWPIEGRTFIVKNMSCVSDESRPRVVSGIAETQLYHFLDTIVMNLSNMPVALSKNMKLARLTEAPQIILHALEVT